MYSVVIYVCVNIGDKLVHRLILSSWAKRIYNLTDCDLLKSLCVCMYVCVYVCVCDVCVCV